MQEYNLQGFFKQVCGHNQWKYLADQLNKPK